MIQSISTINWFGVAAALVAYSALGALWFTLLFKKQYAKSLGKENQKLENLLPKLLFFGTFSSVIFLFCYSLLLSPNSSSWILRVPLLEHL